MKKIAILGFIMWLLGCFLPIDAGGIEPESFYDTFGFGVVIIIIIPLMALFANKTKAKSIAFLISVGSILILAFLILFRIIIAAYDPKSGDILLFRNCDVIYNEPAWLFLGIGMALIVFSLPMKTIERM